MPREGAPIRGKIKVGANPEKRRKAALAVRLWAGLTLSSIVILAALTAWHLVRRGRLLQASLGPPRPKPEGLDGGEARTPRAS